jgi:uncharacterized DUF497 family protein
LAGEPHIRFEWDDVKNGRCLRDHGFGFAGRLFVIVYERRGTVTRIISARKANARERHRYDEN